MSCIHDNETILAKKAKLVKIQIYVKTKQKNSHYYAVLYNVIVII